jgi:hypothetical protein
MGVTVIHNVRQLCTELCSRWIIGLEYAKAKRAEQVQQSPAILFASSCRPATRRLPPNRRPILTGISSFIFFHSSSIFLLFLLFNYYLNYLWFKRMFQENSCFLKSVHISENIRSCGWKIVHRPKKIFMGWKNVHGFIFCSWSPEIVHDVRQF